MMRRFSYVVMTLTLLACSSVNENKNEGGGDACSSACGEGEVKFSSCPEDAFAEDCEERSCGDETFACAVPKPCDGQGCSSSVYDGAVCEAVGATCAVPTDCHGNFQQYECGADNLWSPEGEPE